MFLALASLVASGCRTKPSERQSTEAVSKIQSAVTTGPNCSAAGDPTVGVEVGQACTGGLSAATFSRALCACGTINVSNSLTTDGFDSTVGGPNGGLGADIAANAGISWSTTSSIGGTLWTPGNLSSPNSSTVRSDLRLGGSLLGGGTFNVNRNAFVVKTLPTWAHVLGTTTKVASVAAPCDCSNKVPIASIVAAHRAPNNDDTLISLSPTAYVGNNPATLDLPCGNYYLTQINAAQPLTIKVHGHTALYVDGNVQASGTLAVQIDPTATLDMFVAGTFSASQSLTLGSPSMPGRCRAFVAGTNFVTSGTATFGCNVYAPNALVSLANNAVVSGSVFANNIQVSGNATVHYDTSILGVGGECCTAAKCDDANPCTVDSCNGNGTCAHTTAANGATCTDGNACTQTDTCQAGVCTGANPVVCAASDQCHVAGTCNSTTGACSNPNKSNGSACSDGNGCTQTDTCQAGVCAGTNPVVCAASDQCHVAGTCNATTGICSNPNKADGAACNDGSACTQTDKCQAGVCAGQNPVVCVASDQCHAPGTCNAATGACSNPVVGDGTACNDGNACTQTDACQAGACTGVNPVVCAASDQCHAAGTCNSATGTCSNPSKSNGSPCDDGNGCTQTDTCQAGSCAGANPVVCAASDQCHVAGTCSAASGTCSNPAKANGSSCSDGSACTSPDQCQAGACTPGPVLPTDDGNPCTADSCDAVLGVRHLAVAAGTTCSAADACHAAGACNASGECLPGASTPVDDGNPCTVDSCAVTTGVAHVPAPAGTECPNGNACDGNEACNALGNCLPGPATVVDDGNPCTVDACDTATGVSHTPRPAGTSCSDSNACNGAETCSAAGACVAGAAPNLDDGNPCTTDSCDATAGVSHTPKAIGASCSDGDPCNGVEACSASGSCVASGAPQIDDGNSCTDDSCDASTGVHHTLRSAGSSCADVDQCNGAETCSAVGVCLPGTPPSVDDGNPCTDDSCSAGLIQHTPATSGKSCSDGNACNGLEQCDGAGACRPGAALVVDDGNVCTVDVCNPTTGSVSHSPQAAGTSCDNATICDGRETCDASGVCGPGTPLVVDDGNPCTLDSCDPLSGVLHNLLPVSTACDDATLCNGHEACNASGVCAAGPAPVVDDGNSCTTDSCDPVLGPRHTAVAAGTSCSDGNACNGLEACSASGVCQAGSAPVLDDGNPCTVDSCSPGAGSVQHTPLAVGSSCPDQNVCNGAETCDAVGVCSAGTPANVDDGNPCTTDSCDPLSGVTHVPLNTPECQARAGWAQLLSSQPSPRDGAAGTFIGTGELLLFGGDNAGAMLGDAWLWSPASRSWRRAASGPAPRAGAAMAYDAQRKVAVLFGGVDGALATAAYLNDVWEYDASTDKWTQRIATGEVPAGRALAAFAFDSSRGRALLFGGVSGSAFSDTWEWSAAQARWTQLAAGGPSARYGAAFAFDEASGTYALFGGSPGNASGVLDDTWTLNATSGVWQHLSATQKPPGRAGAVMASDPQVGRFVLVGGTGTPGAGFADTWELNAQAGTWQSLPVDQAPTSETGAVLAFDVQTARLTFASGLSYSSSGAITPQSSAVWQLDRQLSRWTDRAARQAPTELRLGAAFDSSAQTIVALGPVPPPERPLMWSFNPRSSQWSAQDVTDVDHPFSDGLFAGPGNLAANLFYAASVSRLIANASGQFLEWDGTTWSKRCDLPTVAGSPLNLAYANMAFDAATQRLYTAGGAFAGVFGQPRNQDVYRIDVATCSGEVLRANLPPKSRDDSVAVWDSDRNRLIQFGGLEYVNGTPTFAAETWEFDPSSPSWTQITGASPPARSQATAVYDPVRRRVIVHGGLAASGRLFDTWELDPNARTWTQITSAGPSPGEQATMVYDQVRNAPALVSTRGAVWHLISGAWNADLNPIAPSARSGMSGGWSPISGLGIFFGGTSGDGQRDFLGDLWLWRDGWRGVYPGAGGSSLIASGQGSDATLNNVPASRTGHVFATGLVRFGTTHIALLFGGEGASDQYFGLFGDTWSFDESRMEWRAAPKTQNFNIPRGRTGHAISVVPTRGYLMFGGLTRDKFQVSGDVKEQRNFYLNETWLWVPDSLSGWTPLSNGNVPSERYGHAMVTDESTNQIILFGGRTASGVSNETWALSLNGLGSTANWRKLAPSKSPLGRFGHSMSYDPVRHKVVLTGGEGASPNQVFGDTWEFDSATEQWTARNIQPLEGRAGHVTFFDRTRSQLIAFGGFAHRDAGSFALTYGDTLAFVRPNEADPSGGFGNGARCATAAECASGNCVDGFCCNSSCTGQCGACDVAGSEGTCSAAQGSPHGSRASCGSSGGECATQCNGTDVTKCNAPPVGTACGPAAPACVGDNTLIPSQGSCDASGSCVIPQVSCGAYICCDGIRCVGLPKQCVTNCQGADSLCAIGYKCNGPGPFPRGQCYLATKITSFSNTPLTAKVGVPMTFSVTASDPATQYQWLYSYQFANVVFPTCPGSTCSWTPIASDAGKTITWTVNAGGVAPSTLSYNDDTRSVTFTVQP